MSRSLNYSAVLLPLVIGCLMMSGLSQTLFAQQAFTWQQIRDKFETSNPMLHAGEINIAESRAQEITAFLRPNPSFSVIADQIQPFPATPYQPLASVLQTEAVSYLHERGGKRELRRDSAQKGTAITVSQLADQERTLLFNVRNAFVQILQAKAILELSRENLAYWDQVLSVSRDRFNAGDIAKVDFNKLELQRIQYEQDLETSTVSLRTAKIQLLMLLNDRTPIEQFDVTGPFDFMNQITPLDELRRIALDARPDLRAAMQAVDKAQTDHRLAIANGSTDPTFGLDYGYNPPLTQFIGFNISIPLRIFDRNQGEKLRTQLDIGRNEQLRNAAQAQVFNDVDSAYVTVLGNINLLRPYKEKYLGESTRVRETMRFSFQQGAASLLDFLSAQNDYRAIQRGYLTLIGTYLTASAQLNMAVGREVIQ